MKPWAGILAALIAGTAASAATEGHLEPMKVTPTTEIVYPAVLAKKYIDHGEARVIVMVDEKGRLGDWMVTGYSHPLFAKEALDALPRWKFEPAQMDGRPIMFRGELRFRFRNGGLVRVVPGDMELTKRLRDMPYSWPFRTRIFNSDELDRMPDAVVEVAPMPPDQLGARATQGQVTVDYLIDVDGKVRMPIVLSSDDDAFTQSVLLALTEWRYETPRRDGAAVVARVARRFDFRPVRVSAGTDAPAALPDRT